MMKYQTIIGNHYFRITVGFQHIFLNVRKPLGDHANNSVIEFSQILFGRKT